MQDNSLCELKGPSELVDNVLNHRNSLGKELKQYCGNISNEGLRTLIQLSYYTSFQQEEGLYPAFRICVAGRHITATWRDPWKLAHFSEPISLQSVRELRKLAQCSQSHDYALEVREVSEGDNNPRLICCGIRLAHSGEGGVKVFTPTLFSRHTGHGLMIRIDAPGEIRVSEGLRTWELGTGDLIDLGGYPLHPLPTWLDKVAKKFGKSDEQLFLGTHRLLDFAWHEILRSASDQRRGGSFVILPTSNRTLQQLEQEHDIAIKYPMSGVGLAAAAVDYLQKCRFQEQPEDNAAEDEVNDWLVTRHMFSSKLGMIANVSGVDGCTVFDEDLNLLGFGGSIKLPDGNAQKKYLDARDQSKEIDPSEIKKTGKRHSSAYNLCQAHTNVWCFVISQDGHATAIWSDQQVVRRWSPYPPWAKASDHK